MDIVDVLTERLKVLMKEYGVKAAPLARRATLNESAVRDILRGRSKNPGIVTLQKIASVLKLRPSALFEGGQAWPIIGEISAEGHVNDYKGEDVNKMAVENPFFYFREENYAALLENSGSIAPFAFDGDYLIFDRGRTEVRDQDLGRPCVCYLDDGRVLVLFELGPAPGGKFKVAHLLELLRRHLLVCGGGGCCQKHCDCTMYRYRDIHALE